MVKSTGVSTTASVWPTTEPYLQATLRHSYNEQEAMLHYSLPLSLTSHNIQLRGEVYKNGLY